jgi:hypothetical protein
MGTPMEMKAGHELDASIAEKVMGWRLLNKMTNPTTAVAGLPPGISDDGKVEFQPIPHYSTDIAAAWEVVEILREEWDIKIDSYHGWGKSYNPDEGPNKVPWKKLGKNWACSIRPLKDPDHEEKVWNTEVEDTAPHAICLAALKAKGAL